MYCNATAYTQKLWGEYKIFIILFITVLKCVHTTDPENNVTTSRRMLEAVNTARHYYGTINCVITVHEPLAYFEPRRPLKIKQHSA